jgi:hypothetical protein
MRRITALVEAAGCVHTGQRREGARSRPITILNMRAIAGPTPSASSVIS